MTKQLTFAQLNLASRTDQKRPAMLLNPTVPLEIKPRLKRQAEAIYAALKRGPLWTNDLRSMVAQYNSRLKELRAWLRGSGMTVDMTAKAKDGNNRYELRPFAGSKYEAHLMARQKTLATEHTEHTE